MICNNADIVMTIGQMVMLLIIIATAMVMKVSIMKNDKGADYVR